MIHNEKVESFVAIGSFLVAAALSFIGQQMSDHGDIRGGTLMGVAQFLTLCATLFGIDYKIRKFEHEKRHKAND